MFGIFKKKKTPITGMIEVEMQRGKPPVFKSHGNRPVPPQVMEEVKKLVGSLEKETPKEPTATTNSALEQMILKRRKDEVAESLAPHIKALVEAVSKWSLPHDEDDCLENGIKALIEDHLNEPVGIGGIARFEEFVLDDFGQKVLGKLKKDAGRK